ncbi:hypothetical protein FA95DRAFT_224869 [Auriscalpium vulgare]|uniref:Uncharacterized protein n=1 Tax=Auriscalpium vulgare TaxID=40419 RepID=A0ACB8RKK2_9AGAM|nr:hypothetical protein FA95DRAFT_224869 [Auriscalpium vulgare]
MPAASLLAILAASSRRQNALSYWSKLFCEYIARTALYLLQLFTRQEDKPAHGLCASPRLLYLARSRVWCTFLTCTSLRIYLVFAGCDVQAVCPSEGPKRLGAQASRSSRALSGPPCITPLHWNGWMDGQSMPPVGFLPAHPGIRVRYEQMYDEPNVMCHKWK